MTTKDCARCGQIVYPTEELKCMEKLFHKTCFRCTECDVLLNLRTFKGFNKQPYCGKHLPSLRATPVTDSVDMRRITQNTINQSMLQYRSSSMRFKGKVHIVRDDGKLFEHDRASVAPYVEELARATSQVASAAEISRQEAQAQKILSENAEAEEISISDSEAEEVSIEEIVVDETQRVEAGAEGMLIEEAAAEAEAETEEMQREETLSDAGTLQPEASTIDLPRHQSEAEMPEMPSKEAEVNEMPNEEGESESEKTPRQEASAAELAADEADEKVISIQEVETEVGLGQESSVEDMLRQESLDEGMQRQEGGAERQPKQKVKTEEPSKRTVAEEVAKRNAAIEEAKQLEATYNGSGSAVAILPKMSAAAVVSAEKTKNAKGKLKTIPELSEDD